MNDQFYKWLNPGMLTTYQDFKWPAGVGEWTPKLKPRLCQSGWHLATFVGIGEHAKVGAELWLAEGSGDTDAAADKVAFSQARLLSRIGVLDHQTAVRWAAACAGRVLKHYEFFYPGDDRPSAAINAALKWANNPTEKNRRAADAANAAAYAASDAAYAAYAANDADAAYAAAYNAAYAANAALIGAAYNAAYAANDADAAYAADAAAYAAAYAANDAAANAALIGAAHAAAYAANAAANAANATAYAANAAAYAANDDRKEREWQSNRLLELIQG